MIKGKSEDQLLELIATYGEAELIHYLSKSMIEKQEWMNAQNN